MKSTINVNLEVALEMPNRLHPLIISTTELTAERGSGMILEIAEDKTQDIADIRARGIIGLFQKIGGKMIYDMTLKETGQRNSHKRT